MQDLKLHEQFEIEVLDYLNSTRLLNNFVFGGGTMLRLCYELNRYSVDLDFYFTEQSRENAGGIFAKIINEFEKKYVITDNQEKFHTFLLEIRHNNYPNRLKIEINKDRVYKNHKPMIAFSKHADHQVMVKTIPIAEMMENKIRTFLDRKEIRDVFDIEFLYRRGIKLPADSKKLRQLQIGIQQLTSTDFKVKLGSIVSPEFREYYNNSKFEFLEKVLGQQLSSIK